MHGIELQIAVEKVNKYASSESGDTVEVVERPRGGVSVVMADGQQSGRSAKLISNLVVRKAISLLAEGVRDGAVASATHDYLHTQRGGKVSAELNIVSVDLVTDTVVVSRNSHCPTLLRYPTAIQWLDGECEAVGIHRNTKPAIAEFPVQTGLTLILFSDGVWSAGAFSGARIDIPALIAAADADNHISAARLADAILTEATRLESGRPRDDATVLVVKLAHQKAPESVRRLYMRFPI